MPLPDQEPEVRAARQVDTPTSGGLPLWTIEKTDGTASVDLYAADEASAITAGLAFFGTTPRSPWQAATNVIVSRSDGQNSVTSAATEDLFLDDAIVPQGLWLPKGALEGAGNVIRVQAGGQYANTTGAPATVNLEFAVKDGFDTKVVLWDPPASDGIPSAVFPNRRAWTFWAEIVLLDALIDGAVAAYGAFEIGTASTNTLGYGAVDDSTVDTVRGAFARNTTFSGFSGDGPFKIELNATLSEGSMATYAASAVVYKEEI